MGCCNSTKSLRPITEKADALRFEYTNGSDFTVHKLDISGFIHDETTIVVSLIIGWNKEFKKSELGNLNFVLTALANL